MVGQIHMGRYQIQRLLGEGGMGRVYLARQLDLGRQVVVKVMHEHIATDPKFCERFQRETLLMARFQHPYAVSLYDASPNDPEGPCIVMEYIKGVTLDVLLQRNGRLSPTRVGRILGQLCEVLQAAHHQGIIHRDLKPANLMIVDPDTPYEIVKVMDFGLAKLLEPDANRASVSNAEFAVGTPGYMCPEQARGEEMDHRGDLYSVGVILYELLTGRLPFTGEATMDVLIAHATEDPPRFAEMGVMGAVTPAIEDVIRSCLAKDPNDRPSCGRDLAARYETALLESSTPIPTDGSLEDTVAPVMSYPQTQTPAEPSPVPSPKAVATLARPQKKFSEPLSMVQHFDAWMPENIAAYKLQGFVDDVGGELVDKAEGYVHLRLGGKGSAYVLPRGRSFFGLGSKPTFIEVELQLDKVQGGRNNHLQITVLLRPSTKSVGNIEAWRARCEQIFCDLRGYLMGQSSVSY